MVGVGEEFPGYLKGEREMYKKLTISAVTGFLLLGAPGVAMAQEEPSFPPFLVFGIQTTANIEVDIAEGDPCADAIAAIREAGLRRQEVNAFQEDFLVFVFSREGFKRGAATLVCAPEGTPPVPTPVDGR